MTLTTGALKLKGFVEGVTDSIAGEVKGRQFTGVAKLTDMVASADPTIGGLARGLRDFAGHTQSWGRLYGLVSLTDGKVVRNHEGSVYTMGLTEVVLFNGDRQELTYCTKLDDSGFTTGDAVNGYFYRRTKQTGNSWILMISWLVGDGYYQSDWGASSSFNLYDFKWLLENCLLRGEKIMVGEGKFLPVEEIKEGMYVYTMKEDQTKLGLYRVLKAKESKVDAAYEVEYEDGSSFKCSVTHRIMTNKGILGVGELDSWKTFKDDFDTVKGYVMREGVFQEVGIKTISLIDCDDYVYHITVDEAHTYIGENGVFHHNIK